LDRSRAEFIPRHSSGSLEQLLRHCADSPQQNMPAGLPIRSEGSIQSADSGRLPRSHAAAQEEEEASPLVSSLPQNPAEEGRVVESRPQFHSLRSPRTAL